MKCVVYLSGGKREALECRDSAPLAVSQAPPLRRHAMPDDDRQASERMLCCAGGAGGAGGARRETAAWRAAAAELAGTALLVLLACLPPCARASDLHAALAAGLAVTLVVQTFGHVSGAQLNPAVTLAAALWRRTGAARAALYVAAQLAGAALGAALLLVLRPAGAACCVTRPAPGLALAQALLAEWALSACLVAVNCAAWDERTRGRTDAWPLRLGLSVAALSLAGGSLTGASMNPARSFGPALVSGDWTRHWVYWVSPLSAAAVCAPAYRALWPPPAPPSPTPAPPAPAPDDKHRALP